MATKRKTKENIEQKKEEVRNVVHELLQEIDTCTDLDVEALEEASKGITSVKLQLVSMKKDPLVN